MKSMKTMKTAMLPHFLMINSSTSTKTNILQILITQLYSITQGT